MNTRWIILFFSLIYLLLLNNQAEAYGGPKLVAKRRFPLERVVQVFGCYWGQRGWLLWKFVKVKLSFFLLQHQDPGQETTKPLDYEWSIPVEREVRQKEVSWCFNYDDIWKPWASLLSSKREAFIWLNQVKYIIWIALSKENISKVSFIRLGICKPWVCDSTWSKI